MLFDIWAVVRKDLLIERQRSVFRSRILPLGAGILLAFGFAVPSNLEISGVGRSALAQVGPGLMWVTVFFMMLYLLDRSFGVESADGSLQRLVSTGADTVAFFFGKVISVFVLALTTVSVLGALGLLLFDISLERPLLLLVVAVLGSFALSATGTLFSALVIGAKSDQGLMALLLLPASVPILLAAIRSTEVAVQTDANSSAGGWVFLLLALATLYTGVGLLTFESVLED